MKSVANILLLITVGLASLTTANSDIPDAPDKDTTAVQNAPPPSCLQLQSDLLDIKSYLMREEAARIREEAYSAARQGLESTLIQAIIEEMKFYRVMVQQLAASSQMAASKLALLERIPMLEDRIEETNDLVSDSLVAVEQKIDKKIDESNSFVQKKIEETTSLVEQKIEETHSFVEQKLDATNSLVGKTTSLVDVANKRLGRMMSEVRLISLYKVAGQNNPHPGQYDAQRAVDGDIISGHGPESGYTLSGNTKPDNKLWVELGGLFKIHQVKIINMLDCCRDQFVGTKVYADTDAGSKLIGKAQGERYVYDFLVPSNEAVYARNITLHQELKQTLHIMELQVWGTGPFSEDDKF